MGSLDQQSVIQRKARASRDVFETSEMSPAKALRLSLAREADALFGLSLTVATVEQMRLPLAEIGELFEEGGLLVLLDGTGGARGALQLDPAFLSALIEVQTTGRVQDAPGRPRLPTRTDAAMVAPLIDAVLSGMDRQIAEPGGDQRPPGFSFGDMVETVRALSLLLVAAEFDLLRLTVDIGPGIRTGKLDLLLPHQAARKAVAPDTGARACDTLGSVVLTAPLVLDAAVARLSLPLRDLWRFKIGDLVPIPREAIGDTRLLGTKGHVVARGRLGQMNGWRAVQLSAAGGAALPEAAEATQPAADLPSDADPAPPGPPPPRETSAGDLPATVQEPG